MNDKNFQLVNAMIKSGVTGKVLSIRADVPYNDISECINNKRILTPEQQMRIANVLGVDIKEVF